MDPGGGCELETERERGNKGDETLISLPAAMEAEHRVDSVGHKRADPEGAGNDGDAKRPREDGNGLHSSSMDLETGVEDYDYVEENPLDVYREIWINDYSRLGISFEDETEIPPMQHTDGPMICNYAEATPTLQVLYVKVTQITDALQWPLDVYGVIAVRDSLDHKRNFLFRRTRENCQTLASLQDAELELTGPSRAVLLLDPHAFEIDLKVRGKEGSPPSEDKALSYYAFVYENIAHESEASYARTEVVPTEHSTIEVRFAHLAETVEATIQVIVDSGSREFSARFTAHTASINEDMVLLDSRGGKVSVTEKGEVVLKRRVVTVEERGRLILGVEAAACHAEESGGAVVKRQVLLIPRSALRSDAYFGLGFNRLHVIVAWSLLP